MTPGIDMEELSRFQNLIHKQSFVNRVLTLKEREIFQKLNEKRKIEYLAGRWVAKEAFSKAWETGIGKLSFLDIEILNHPNGAPYFSKTPSFEGNAKLSISHTNSDVVAIVIIERMTNR